MRIEDSLQFDVGSSNENDGRARKRMEITSTLAPLIRSSIYP